MYKDKASIAVVMVNWNGGRHTISACQSLQRNCEQILNIVVVDNASTDDSIAQMKKELFGINLLCNSINSGFAGGCNLGIKRAIEIGSEYIFLLNNDALVNGDTISQLLAASKQLNDTAILGSAVRYMDRNVYQFFGSRSGALNQPKWFEDPLDRDLLLAPLIATDFVLGAALFLPTKMLLDIGMFDERFYLTYEDADLCYRARARGFQCFIVSESVVYHHASATMGPESAPLQTYFLTRNELLFAQKHCPLPQRITLYFRRTGRFLKRIVCEIVGRKSSDICLKAMALGFRDFALRRFGNCPDIIRRYAIAWRSQNCT